MILNLKNINQQGFSLLELLIYVAILSSFLLVIVNLFFIVSSNSAREEVRSEVRQNLRFSTQKITDDVHSAKEIVSATLPDGGAGNILDIKSIDGTVLRYSVMNGTLRRIVKFGLPEENSEPVTTDKVTVNIAPEIFNRIGNTIQINLKIDYNDSGREDYKFFESVKTTASLRL